MVFSKYYSGSLGAPCRRELLQLQLRPGFVRCCCRHSTGPRSRRASLPSRITMSAGTAPGHRGALSGGEGIQPQCLRVSAARHRWQSFAPRHTCEECAEGVRGGAMGSRRSPRFFSLQLAQTTVPRRDVQRTEPPKLCAPDWRFEQSGISQSAVWSVDPNIESVPCWHSRLWRLEFSLSNRGSAFDSTGTEAAVLNLLNSSGRSSPRT